MSTRAETVLFRGSSFLPRETVLRGRGVKLGNAYAALLEGDYDRIPKAVLAAIAVSFACRIIGEGSEIERLAASRRVVREEWAVLYGNGVVPQEPR